MEDHSVPRKDLTQVLSSAFILNGLIIGGPLKSLGVYFIQFQNEFGVTAGQTSLVVMLLFASFYLFGPLVAIMSNILGLKKVTVIGCLFVGCGSIIASLAKNIAVVYVSLGILTGAGACMMTNCVFAVLGRLFKKKRSFANNMFTTGSAVFSIALGPLMQYLIDNYGWRGALLIFGGILLNAVPFSLLMLPIRIDEKYFRDAPKRVLEYKLLKSPTFLLLVSANGLHMCSLISITIYLVRFAQYQGLNRYLAASLPSIIGVVDVILRPFAGMLTSVERIKRSYIFAVSALVQSMVVCGFLFVQEFYQFAIVTIAYAACLSFIGALPVTVLMDMFGAQNLSSSLGLRAAVMGVFSLSMPAIIALLVDKTGSYYVPFYSSIILAVLASVTVTCCQLWDNYLKK